MKAVVKASDGKHNDALACYILKCSGNGNRASLTDQVRLCAKNYRREVRRHVITPLIILYY